MILLKKATLAFLLLFAVSGLFAQNGSSGMTVYVGYLMKRMTLEEKIGQLNLLTPGGGVATGAVVSSDVESKIRRGQVGGLFGVIGVDKIRQAQTLAVTGSRLKIPLLFGSDIIHGYKTTWPIPLALSCSWDTALVEESARMAADEATADGLSWAFSPMVDIARDPRWGRVAEGAGEDPFLGSQLSAAMVRGYQGKDLSADNTLMACVKHFALYGAAEGGRDYNTTDMSRVKMYEYYLPPYKAAVDAGVGSVMSSFNEIDGIPATANRWLMTDLLRRQWGFKGFVVTDYTAINEMIEHGMGDLQEVSRLALKAGIDMDMVGEGFLTTLQKSLKEGKVTLADIDAACRRVLEAKYKLGLFEDPFRYCNADRARRTVQNAAMRAAARRYAARSAVLLKNDRNLLPLQARGTIALIGPLANNRSNMLGTWAVSGDAQTSVPIYEALRRESGVNVLYAKGANITDDTALAKRANVFGERVDRGPGTSKQLLDSALAVAQAADVIVAVLGEASEFTGEAASRSDIGLPASQQALLTALKATGKPIVVVLMSGRPLTIENEARQADALLQYWFPGHEAGNALADLLFGRYNPSGRLSMSWPRNVGQIPVYYNHKNTGRPQPAGEGQKFRSNYLDVSNDPLFAFGYGLSYTQFTYGPLTLDKTHLRRGETLMASVTVTNSGAYDGEEVVQLYIADPVASVTQPVRKLKAFRKVNLRKGERRTIRFPVTVNELSFYNSALQWVAEPGEFRVQVGPSSDRTQSVSFVLDK
ncbi:beta-glucosidase BglX [Flaviaesturariibacter aridisoli]|uniref:Periplasmic beta-glucosidase n=1 Tax=Flaviaesturariibacter aridisoli TaxID=2545761 RepID=A0A4R4E3Q5_9BACT|nr:beta-glucosidase BglX [Flaviaesturariibacter aridisoli]TCZ72236.1 beta-glucosidase BglX [Flaviaesturariibacter aridisoli]